MAVLGFLTGCAPGDAKRMANTGDAESSSTTGRATEQPFVPDCIPREYRCEGSRRQVCAPTGRQWLDDPCDALEVCQPCDGEGCVPACVGPCQDAIDHPSSAGCDFFASRTLHSVWRAGRGSLPDYPDNPNYYWNEDRLVIANTHPDLTATVSIFHIPEGKRKEVLVEDVGNPEITSNPFELAPGQVTWVVLDNTWGQAGAVTILRSGGIIRLHSNVPVVAYQFGPGQAISGNDASLLLPDSALAQDYVIATEATVPRRVEGEIVPSDGVSLVEIIALHDDTRVAWTPHSDSAGTGGNGLPVDAIAGGETGTLRLNAHDMLRLVASNNGKFTPSQRDLTGMAIHANKPIWVMAGNRNLQIPQSVDEDGIGVGGQDPAQEIMFPLTLWGNTYVAAASPRRNTERHHWKIVAGADDVSIVADPPIPGMPNPIVLSQRGDSTPRFEVPNGFDFVLTSDDGPFLPLQFLQSGNTNNAVLGTDPNAEPPEGTTFMGDPAMVQMVPVEQFLDRYGFMTGFDFNRHYIQFIRRQGSADIELTPSNGTELPRRLVGDYEIITIELVNNDPSDQVEGAYTATSDDPFGVLQYGWNVMNEPTRLCCCGSAWCDAFPEQRDQTMAECLRTDPPRNSFGPHACRTSYAYPGGLRAEPIYIP